MTLRVLLTWQRTTLTTDVVEVIVVVALFLYHAYRQISRAFARAALTALVKRLEAEGHHGPTNHG